jgi:hypothetical protein
MAHRSVRRLNLAAKVTLAAAGIVGIADASAIQAQTSAQPAVAAAPKFAVASVKPCKDDADPGFRGGRGIAFPGMLDLNCDSLRRLIARLLLDYRETRGCGERRHDEWTYAASASRRPLQAEDSP